MLKYGDRSSVWNGTAKQTRGGLTKEDLVMSRTGKIVSKKKSESAKAWYKNNGGFKKRQKTPEPTPVPEEPPKKKRKYKRKNKSKNE